MDWALLHIVFVHFPVILTVTGALAVLLAVVHARRGSWLHGTVSLTLAAIATIPAYLTGLPTARVLGQPWYVAPGMVGLHEAAAKVAALLVVLAGLIAVVAWRRLVRYPREVRMPTSLRAALVVTAVAAAMAVGYASVLGERIVHLAPALHGAPPGPTAP